MMKEILALLADSKEMFISYGMSLLGAILLLIVGWIVAGWAQRVVRRLMDRSTIFDATLKPLVASIVRYVILIFVVVAVLAQFGVQTTSIIAVMGAAGLAIGLALQGTLANIAAGVMILILRPFEVGETIEADGVTGTVKFIGLFTTIFTTLDGIYASVPNSQLWNSKIQNMSRRETRRVEVAVGIGYGDDIDKALAIAKSVVEADKRTLKDPEPAFIVSDLGESSVNLFIRAWVNTADYGDARSDLTKAIKQGFDAGGISIPFPQRDVHYIGAGAANDSGKQTAS
jgi:small conductance mechanosensitive channel